MRVPRQMQQLAAIEILDRGARLYRANLRLFLIAVCSLVITVGFVYYMLGLLIGGVSDWDSLLPVRADALATLLGVLPSPLLPIAQHPASWLDAVLYLLLQMSVVSTIVPLSAQLYLRPFTDLLPAHDTRLARMLQLLPPLALLLPIDVLIACLANLFETLPMTVQQGSRASMSWSMLVPLMLLSIVPIEASFAATLLVTRLWCAPQAMMLEGCGPAAGLRRSWRLTRGQFRRVAALIGGVSILVALIGAVPVSAAMFAAELTNATSLSLLLLGIAPFVAKIAQVLMLPVPPIVATLLYYDLRTRAEGYDLEVAARQALLDGAAAKQQQGDLQGALADYEQSLTFAPDNLQLLCTLVDLKVRLGYLDGARVDSERAVALFPKDAHARNNHGYVRMQLGDLDGALADFNRALGSTPHHPMMLTNRAHVLHQRGDYQAAQADLFHALQFEPNNARAMYNMACGYAKQDQPEPALEWLGRAIAEDEHFGAYAHADADFNGLRDDPRFVALLGAGK
jgi:Flp pilus assembly protein TadD